MKVIDAFQALCKATNLWGVYLSTSPPDDFKGDFYEEVSRATCLSDEDVNDLVLKGQVILTFDREEACRQAYEAIVGDEGPTRTNPYNGEVKVYALTCDATGQLRNENT